MKQILLYSGGMDSYIAWHYLHKPPTLYVNIGHKYATKEIKAIYNTIPETRILNNLDLHPYEHPDAWIPMRNLLLTQFAALEGADIIYLVCQKGEQSIPDRAPAFFYFVSKLLTTQMKRNISVLNPFGHMTKVQMVEWYVKNVGDIGELKKTVGCFDKEEGHCGHCASCFRRSVAFAANNIPLDNEQIKKWDGIPKYIRDLNAGKYEPERTIETLVVLQEWGWKVD